MSVGFWPEDRNSWPTVHFNMFPKQFYKVNFSRTILKFYRILKCSNRILCHTGIVAKVKPSVNTTENILGSKKCLEQHNNGLPTWVSECVFPARCWSGQFLILTRGCCPCTMKPDNQRKYFNWLPLACYDETHDWLRVALDSAGEVSLFVDAWVNPVSLQLNLWRIWNRER